MIPSKLKKINLFLIFFFSFFAFFYSCSKKRETITRPIVHSKKVQEILDEKNKKEYPKVEFNHFGWVKIKGYSFQIALARTEKELSYGLMFRESLSKDEGMLFIFKQEAPRAFWMKNVSIPLSVAFMDKEGVILSIKEMKPYDESSVPSDGFAQYALEVSAGRLKELGIQVGDKMEWGESL